jgi:sugar phosphate isomerase/epimerase
MNKSKKNVLIGFAMHPLWLAGGDLESFIGPLRESGVRSLEFEIDSNLSGWEQFEPLMEDCSKIGIEICFHAPYRSPFSLRGFRGDRRSEIINANMPLWSLAESWAKRNNFRTEIVLHGASSKQSNMAELREDTKTFIIYALEAFPNLTIALENLDVAKPRVIKFGERREDVLALVTEIDHPRLGICWDTGHDIRHGVTQDPSKEWLERVVHVHVHDIDDSGEDHFPLVFDKVPNGHWIQLLMDAGMEGTITLELKGGNLVNWEFERIKDALVKSIKTIHKVIK